MANHPRYVPAYLEVLKHASFRFLWFGQICSQFAVNTLLFVLALRIYQTTSSNVAVSLLFLSHSVPAVLFGLIAGTLVDRLDRRRVIVVCDLLRGLISLTLLLFSSHVLIVYLVTFINSCITQLYVPAEAPLIPRFVPKELLVTANSIFAFTFYSSLAVGSIMAGPLLRLFGPYNFFVVVAVLFWCASFFSSRISAQSAGTIGLRYILRLRPAYLVSRIWSRLKEGVSYVTQSPVLFDAILLLTGTQIVLAMLGSLGPGFADQELGIDVRDASLFLVGPVVLGIVTGSVWVGSYGFRFTSRRLIRWGVASAGIILLLIAGVTRVIQGATLDWISGSLYPKALIVLLFYFLGVANSMLDVPANATLQEEARGSMRGRVYGLLAAFVGGVGVLPVVIGGALADRIGVVSVIGLLGCGIAGYAWIRLRYNSIHPK